MTSPKRSLHILFGYELTPFGYELTLFCYYTHNIKVPISEKVKSEKLKTGSITFSVGTPRRVGCSKLTKIGIYNV